MSGKVLVTYASRTGSTAEVAAAVAEILQKSGAQTDVESMESVTDLTPYQTVIAGSAIQSRQWLPEAMQFMRTHQAALNQQPFAMFSLCMTLAMKNGERFRPDILEWLAPVRRIARPVSEGLFPGVLNIAKIPFLSDRLKFRLSVLFGVWSEGDHRDWAAIKNWANDLPAMQK